MRHLVLALMIVLLPLRGWAGDAMATQMANAAIGTDTRTAHAHETGNTAFLDHENQVFKTAQAMIDCHEQLVGQSDTDKATSNDHCGTCQACQACHTVALSPMPIEVMTSFASPQLRPTPAAAFTSAASALGQKPPIS